MICICLYRITLLPVAWITLSGVGAPVISEVISVSCWQGSKIATSFRRMDSNPKQAATYFSICKFWGPHWCTGLPCRGVCTIDCDVTGEFTRVYQAVHETNYRSRIQFCLTRRHLQFRNATKCRVMAQLQAKWKYKSLLISITIYYPFPFIKVHSYEAVLNKDKWFVR